MTFKIESSNIKKFSKKIFYNFPKVIVENHNYLKSKNTSAFKRKIRLFKIEMADRASRNYINRCGRRNIFIQSITKIK